MAKKLSFDRLLFVAVFLMLALGLVIVYSASGGQAASSDAPVLGLSVLAKQLLAAGIGLVLMVVAMQVDYRLLRRPWLVYSLVGFVIVLLVAVLQAPSLNGVQRWLFIGGFSLQPSELAKPVLVIFLAYQIDRKSRQVNSPLVLVPSLFVLATVGLLVVLEPDFGTALVLIAIVALMLYLAGMAWRYIWIASAVLAPALLLLAMSSPYRLARLTSFMDPESDPQGQGYQLSQSLIAVGSGGLFGRGLGQGSQKLDYLPMANSDFVFSILCEELGLIGAVGLLCLIAVLAWRGLRAGDRAPDDFGRFVAWGLTGWLVLQALLNISITVGLLPITGMPLPFLSYGGTSLVVTLAACGLLLNVSQHA